jgi:hypothetical protein
MEGSGLGIIWKLKKETKVTVWIAGLRTKILTQNCQIRRILSAPLPTGFHKLTLYSAETTGYCIQRRRKYRKHLQVRMRRIILGSKRGTKGIWRKLNNEKSNYSH